MNLLSFLVLFPLLVAVLMYVFPQSLVRGFIVKASSLLIGVASIALLITFFSNNGLVKADLNTELINRIMLAVEVLIAAYIIWQGIKFKKFGVVALALVQILIVIYYEMTYGGKQEIANNLFVDKLSIIMALLIGIIGTLICVYAVGYMKDFHKHDGGPDRSSTFFAILFVFLSAMFGLVFSNNLLWLLFFWEITTLCSFLLIGYTKTEEATRNSFRAIFMNLMGGVAFIIALCVMSHSNIPIELSQMLEKGSVFMTFGSPTIIFIVIALLSFAGITKSAQLPFSSWLLGAMVAPTPVSALLHSSTMVKAGVYLVIRLALPLHGTMVGFTVALLGAVTFLVASCIAISEQNVKKILAYSTIANLGLIVTCAGVGTYQAVWTAILLLIFHAVAKSLLFLSVGTIEHGLHSRDVENMDGLIMKMPRVAAFLMVGISGMFLAPFGMLISKWAALEALIQVNPLLAVFVAFGSAATLFFWTKWMGKIIMVIHPAKYDESFVTKDEWFTLGALSIMTIAICVIFPLLSSYLIDPYIQLIYGHTAAMDKGNIIIMLIMMGMLFVLPLRLIFYSKNPKYVQTYLCGANITENTEYYEANTRFHSAAGGVRDLSLKNYYLEKYFGEVSLGKIGVICGVLIIIIMFGVTLIK